MPDSRIPDPRDDDELTVAEAAAYLHLMITRVLRLCEAGTFGRAITTRHGPDFLIRRADLDAYAAQLRGPIRAQPRSYPPTAQEDDSPRNGPVTS